MHALRKEDTIRRINGIVSANDNWNVTRQSYI